MSKSLPLLAQADKTFSARDYAESLPQFQTAAEAAHAENDAETETEALAQVARAYLIQDKNDEGRPWLEKAKTLADPARPRGWSRYLGVRGRFEWKDGDLPRATATFTEMYNFCLAASLHERAIDAAHMVAITGDPEEQLLWAKKGIEAAEAGNVESWLGPLWNNLAATHEDAGRHGPALEAYVKARHHHYKVGDEQAKLVADWAVGHAHQALGHAEEALMWLRPVLAWAERRYAEKPCPDRAEWIGLTLREIGLCTAATGRTAEALRDLLRARKRLREAKMPEWDAAGFQALEDRIAALETPGEKIRIDALNVVAVYVADLPAAERFYEDVLGFDRAQDMGDGVLLHSKGADLTLYLEGGRTPREAPGTSHPAVAICLNAAQGVKAARAALEAAGVEIVNAYGDLESNFAGIQFQDPSGNLIEIAGTP